MKASFWVGLVAAVCIAVYMLPQLIKIIKTKDTSGISVAMFIIALLGDLFFVIDGILIICGNGDKLDRLSNGLPVLLANALAFTISFIIAFFKFRNMKWAKHFGVKETDIAKDFNHFYKLHKEEQAKKAAERAAKNAEKSSQTPTTPTTPTNIG